jgi:hypothetical protein
MKKIVFISLVSVFLFGGCAVGFWGGPHRGHLVVVPVLPAMVELDADNYYFSNGYYYFYRDNVWFYSESRVGPWVRLPRNHYPREVHFRGHDRDRGDRR